MGCSRRGGTLGCFHLGSLDRRCIEYRSTGLFYGMNLVLAGGGYQGCRMGVGFDSCRGGVGFQGGRKGVGFDSRGGLGLQGVG